MSSRFLRGGTALVAALLLAGCPKAGEQNARRESFDRPVNYPVNHPTPGENMTTSNPDGTNGTPGRPNAGSGVP